MSDKNPKQMTPAQRAYEEKRAAKAGMSLDRYLEGKRKAAEAEARAAAAAKPKPKKDKAPGFFSRLLEKAQKPI